MKTHEDEWKLFIKTGTIENYLKYKEAKEDLPCPSKALKQKR